MTSQDFYVGFWQDWTRGSVTGATLTVDSRAGAYLIAFLALFVHYAGLSSWRLFSYCVFQKRASPSLQEDSRIKEQVVLRNSASPSNALQNFVAIARSDKTNCRWYLILVSALNLGLITVAGIFSSKVTTAESNVLLRPRTCGRWNNFSFPLENTETLPISNFIEWDAAVSETYTLSNSYALACSGVNNTFDVCPALAPRAPQLNKTIIFDCPFGTGMCRGDTVSLDSGFIDSHLHLGINSPEKDRLAARIELQCSPLTMDGYRFTYDETNVSDIKSTLLSWVTDEGLESGLPWTVFRYGSDISFNDSITYVNPNGIGDLQNLGGEEGVTLNYLFAFTSYEGCPPLAPGCGSDFEAIPEIRVPGSDTILMFVSNQVSYSAPVTDPIFDAQEPYHTSVLENLGNDTYKAANFTLYSGSNKATVLGCAQSVHICHEPYTQPDNCVRVDSGGFPYGPNDTKGNITDILNLTRKQTGIAARIQDAIYQSSLTTLVTGLGAQILLAHAEVSGNTAPPLPPDQWTLEVQNFFTVMITNMQVYSMQFVTGYQSASLAQQQADAWSQHISYPADEDSWMCNNQIIQSTEYASFSVLGLCIILIVGGLLIIADVSVVAIVNRIRSKTPQNRHRQEAWDLFALLELQHLIKDDQEEDEDDEGKADSGALSISPSTSSTEPTRGKKGRVHVDMQNVEEQDPTPVSLMTSTTEVEHHDDRLTMEGARDDDMTGCLGLCESGQNRTQQEQQGPDTSGAGTRPAHTDAVPAISDDGETEIGMARTRD